MVDGAAMDGGETLLHLKYAMDRLDARVEGDPNDADLREVKRILVQLDRTDALFEELRRAIKALHIVEELASNGVVGSWVDSNMEKARELLERARETYRDAVAAEHGPPGTDELLDGIMRRSPIERTRSG